MHNIPTEQRENDRHTGPDPRPLGFRRRPAQLRRPDHSAAARLHQPRRAEGCARRHPVPRGPERPHPRHARAAHPGPPSQRPLHHRRGARGLQLRHRREPRDPHGRSAARPRLRRPRQSAAGTRRAVPGRRRGPALRLPAEPEVQLRQLRHRRIEPFRPRRRGRGRRGAGQGLQPALHLRRLRARQDPPPARHRPLRREPLSRDPGALRQLRGVHERLHQLDREQPRERLPVPLSRDRHPAHRRHPVPAGQGLDAGGLLPYLQYAARSQQAGRDHQRRRARSTSPDSKTGCGRASSGD